MIRKGLAVAVILLFVGVAFAIPINANVSKSSLEPVTDIKVLEEDDATPTPIALLFQLITKLCDNKEIQKLEEDADAEVDIWKDTFGIIERDEELNTIVEELKSLDCGCDEDNTGLEWMFPALCTLLLPLQIISFLLLIKLGNGYLFSIMGVIGSVLNCFWLI